MKGRDVEVPLVPGIKLAVSPGKRAREREREREREGEREIADRPD